MSNLIAFESASKLVDYQIITIRGRIEFRGRYRRDLEKPSWHYYERDDGQILHFRKRHMVCVIGGKFPSLSKNKRKKEMKEVQNGCNKE